MKNIHPLRMWIGICILFLSLALLTVSLWPVARAKHVLTNTLIDSPSTAPSAEASGSAEIRRLTIQWPKMVRVGDADLVHLTYAVDQNGNLSPVAGAGKSPIGEQIIEIPYLYESNNLVLEVRLDMAGLQVTPQATISEPLRPGQTLSFSWSISPVQASVYRGNLWVYLNIVPKGGGDIDRRALVAYRMEIEARSILGLPVNVARWGGAAGSVLGLVLCLPFLEEFLRKTSNRTGRNRIKNIELNTDL
jgi:hypothetical protein